MTAEAEAPGGHGAVYVFHDRAGEVVYVGKTTNEPRVRHRGHMGSIKSPGTPMAAWLAECHEAGFVPPMHVIERPRLGDLDERELFWIEHYHAKRGKALLNVAGVPNGRTSRPRREPAPCSLTPPRMARCAACDAILAPSADREVAPVCRACAARRAAALTAPRWERVTDWASMFDAWVSETMQVEWHDTAHREATRDVAFVDATDGDEEFAVVGWCRLHEIDRTVADPRRLGDFGRREVTKTARELFEARKNPEKVAAIWLRAVWFDLFYGRAWSRFADNAPSEFANIGEMIAPTGFSYHHAATEFLPVLASGLPHSVGVLYSPGEFVKFAASVRLTTLGAYRVIGASGRALWKAEQERIAVAMRPLAEALGAAMQAGAREEHRGRLGGAA